MSKVWLISNGTKKCVIYFYKWQTHKYNLEFYHLYIPASDATLDSVLLEHSNNCMIRKVINGSVSSFDKTSPCSFSWFSFNKSSIFSNVKIFTSLFSLLNEFVTSLSMSLNSVVGPMAFSSRIILASCCQSSGTKFNWEKEFFRLSFLSTKRFKQSFKMAFLSPGRCKRQAITWPRIGFNADTSIVVIKDSQELINTSSRISWMLKPVVKM